MVQRPVRVPQFVVLCHVLFAFAACGGSGTTSPTDVPTEGIAADVILDGLVPDLQDVADDADHAPADAEPGDVLDAGPDAPAPDAPDEDAANDLSTDAPDADAATDTVQEQIDELFVDLRPECRPVDLGCTADSECEGGARCVGTRCVAPVAAADYVFSPDLHAVTAIVVPPSDVESGFDLTGDGVPDNLFAKALATFPEGTDIANRIFRNFVESGGVSLLVELRDLPAGACGPMAVTLHNATTDLDLDGIPDGGPYQVRRDGFREDGYGPLAQINTAAIDGGLIVSGPGVELPLKFPLMDGTVLVLPLEGLRFRAEIPQPSPTVPTATPLPAALPAPAAPAGTDALLGGYVRMSRLVDEINRQAVSCACAGVDPAKPLAAFSVEDGASQALCVQDFDATPCDQSADGRYCENLPGVCIALTMMTQMADIASGVATDGEGKPVKDSISLAFYLDLAPATLAEPPLAPDFAAVADTWRFMIDCDVVQDDGSTRIGVVANDFYDPAVSPLVVEVSQGVEGGLVTISAASDFVSYTPAAGYWGFDEFTYSIQDGQGNRSTAKVAMRVSPQVAYDPSRPLDAFCALWCDQSALCDPDAFATRYAAGRDACLAGCTSDFGPLWASTTACATAWRNQELCRVSLPCFRVGDFDDAMDVLASGVDPGDIRCEEIVDARLAACGPCAFGQFGPGCGDCPGGQADPCGGGGTCADGQAGDGTCTCAAYWKLDDATGSCVQVDPCLPDPCAGIPHAQAGTCWKADGGDWSCYCDGDSIWLADSHTCLNYCDPNPCDPADPYGNGGQCFAFSTGYECGCKEGYYFDHLTLVCRSLSDPCDPDPCAVLDHAVGPCTVDDYQAACACDEGYTWQGWQHCVLDPV